MQSPQFPIGHGLTLQQHQYITVEAFHDDRCFLPSPIPFLTGASAILAFTTSCIILITGCEQKCRGDQEQEGYFIDWFHVLEVLN